MTPTPDKQAERDEAERMYTQTAHDYSKAPVGSRDWVLFWAGWQMSSGYHLSDAQKKEGEASYPLPDSLYPDSKDWAASNYAGRVEWLHVMYESAKRTVAMLESAPAAAEAPAPYDFPDAPQWYCRLNDVWLQMHQQRSVGVGFKVDDPMACDWMNALNLALALSKDALATPTDSAVNAGAVPSDALAEFLAAQDALDNHELNGQNGTDYFTLVRRRNDARKDLDSMLDPKADSTEAKTACKKCALQPCDICPDVTPNPVRAFLAREYNREATTPAQIARQREIGALLDTFDRKPS